MLWEEQGPTTKLKTLFKLSRSRKRGADQAVTWKPKEKNISFKREYPTVPTVVSKSRKGIQSRLNDKEIIGDLERVTYMISWRQKQGTVG